MDPQHPLTHNTSTYLMLFTSYYAFKQFSRNVPIMLKKVPIMLASFSTKCPFLTITNTLAAILRFRAKSEGPGDFSLLNNETTRTSTSSPGSWEYSGSLPELSIAAGPLLLLVLGPLSMLSTTPFDEHYTCIIPVKLPDYSRIMLYAFADRLFRKLCRHIRRISKCRAFSDLSVGLR